MTPDTGKNPLKFKEFLRMKKDLNKNKKALKNLLEGNDSSFEVESTTTD